MPKIPSSTASLEVDGKTIEIKKDDHSSLELNKALAHPDNFKKFSQDPAAFAKNYGLTIDKTISSQLSKKLQGVDSIHDLAAVGGGGAPATVWAVAEGAYSLAHTKIAVVI